MAEPVLGQPEHGGRQEMRLSCASDTRVTYAVAWLFGASRWQGSAEIALETGTIAWDDSTLAPWAAAATHGWLRALWRSHREDRHWPPRLARWRAEKSAESSA